MDATVNFSCGESPVDISGQVHLLPCVIKHEGPCPVSHYFKPRSTGPEILSGFSFTHICKISADFMRFNFMGWVVR